MGTDKTPVRMLHDRVLVQLDKDAGERRSSSGIVIPATAAVADRRLEWGRVAAVGPTVRVIEIGDSVLFDPDERAEVEITGDVYLLLRERDIHAIAADRLEESETGLYL